MVLQRQNEQTPGITKVEVEYEPYDPNIVEGSSRPLPPGGDEWTGFDPNYRQEKSGKTPPANPLGDPEPKEKKGLGLGRFFRRDGSEQELAERIARQSGETLIAGIEEGETPTHYEVLSNVDPDTGILKKININSSEQEITAAYRNTLRLLRRDVIEPTSYRSGQRAYDQAQVQQVEESYRILSDPRLKAAYDAELKATGRDKERTFDNLPKKYQKQFRKQGKTQARAARDIYAQATALGIDLYRTTTSGGFDVDVLGGKGGGSRAQLADRKAGRRKKTVAELRVEIAEYEAKMAGLSTGTPTKFEIYFDVS